MAFVLAKACPVLDGRSLRNKFVNQNRELLAMMYVGDLWSMISCDDLEAISGIIEIAVAPLPMTITFLPSQDRFSGQLWG